MPQNIKEVLLVLALHEKLLAINIQYSHSLRLTVSSKIILSFRNIGSWANAKLISANSSSLMAAMKTFNNRNNAVITAAKLIAINSLIYNLMIVTLLTNCIRPNNNTKADIII